MVTYLRIDRFGAPPQFERITAEEFIYGENRLGIATCVAPIHPYFSVQVREGSAVITPLQPGIRIKEKETVSGEEYESPSPLVIRSADWTITIMPLTKGRSPILTPPAAIAVSAETLITGH